MGTLNSFRWCNGDDKGLVLPPGVAPIQVVIVPIKTKKNAAVELENLLKTVGFRVNLDDRDNYKPGFKYCFH